MSESQLEAAVLELAGLAGWLRVHFRPAVLPSGKWATHQSGDTGFPDLVLARSGRLAFVELKDSRGRPSREQVRWLDDLETVAGGEVDVCLWRPADWLSGAVAAFLKGEGPAPGKGAWRAVGRRGANGRGKRGRSGAWSEERAAEVLEGALARRISGSEAGVDVESGIHRAFVRRRVMG